MSIAQTIQSARASHAAHNPWGAAAQPALPHNDLIDMTAAPKTTFAPSKKLDPSTLVICDDPIPPHRTKVKNKYDERFEAMRMGQALKVPPQHVGKVAAALRNWISDNKMDAHVRSVEIHPDCPDKLGRVWLMEGPQSAVHVAKAHNRRSA